MDAIEIGTDLVEIDRIYALVTRFGKHFLDKCFTEKEVDYAFKSRDYGASLASQFATKEALAKAMGCGIGAKLSWKDIETDHDDLGRPYVRLSDKAHQSLTACGFHKVKVSVSHTKTLAQSVVLLM